jgi:catabolite regulation protein CreA
MKPDCFGLGLGLALVVFAAVLPARADSDEPTLIFRKSTTFKLLTPNDKLAVYGVDDPVVDGVACHYTVPERGGLAGAFGVAEETSDVSLACRQYGPIRFKDKFEQGDVVFRERRSLLFKNIDLYGLHGQAGRRLAEELDLERADSAVGRRGRRRPEVRRFPALTACGPLSPGISPDRGSRRRGRRRGVSRR